MARKMRVAVIGAGISGLVSAYVLAKEGVNVVLFEKEDYLGGHAKTVSLDGVDLDIGFMVFNRVTYPNMMEFFESLGVDMEILDMSFSVSLDNGQGCELGYGNGLTGLFAQKRNLLNPYFYQMIRDIIKFNNDALIYLEDHENNPDIARNETLGYFIKSRGYSDFFQKAYIVPMCALIWSSPSEGVMNFSAFSILSFFRNHQVLQIFGRPQWLTVRWRSQSYVNKVRKELESKGCLIRTGCAVQFVSSLDGGCCVKCLDGSQEMFDYCILGVHSVDALDMLGKDATLEEARVLGALQYVYSDIYLHRDKKFMPKHQAAWSAWNFIGSLGNKSCLTYWLNIIQNIPKTGEPFLMTINPPHTPDHTLLKWTTSHPVPSVGASKASLELNNIQGKRGIWFCGAYQGFGFHEDGFKAGMVAAHNVLRKTCVLLGDRKHLVPSLTEMGARLIVTKFLNHFITTGRLTLLEEGGNFFSFEGTNMKCNLQSKLRVHNPQFYWKVATQSDIGLADAYIYGDISFVDKEEGLLNLFLIYLANWDADVSDGKKKNRRAWWRPLLFTAGISSAKYILKHILRRNTLTQARRNISRHYDLSNDLFGLFLDETMTYSCAIFKSENEDLREAQLRKLSLLIQKARINNKHEILEIGSGWGSLAIEVVRQTGCKYTGITLSEEQLKYAERKVKESGLQDSIKFLLCDYRQLPKSYKYDRIISCEMIEAVGHEYMEEFMLCCDSVLAEDGVFVLQFISVADEKYEEYRRGAGFMKEYIFPGGCLPSLSRLMSAMASASRLCVEHIENIGLHYYQTLRYWRNNFMEKQREIRALGFDEKFIRTWEYYFLYCAAGFKTRTLGDYQIVFSRPGNISAFKDPYEPLPSA